MAEIILSDQFAAKFTGELDKLFVQGPVTGFFTDNVLRSKFVGAKTVLIPEMDMVGLGDYNRETGFIKGAISIANKPYTLAMDRARSFQLDREDEDETGIANLAGQFMSEFVRTKVVPEVDAYVLSKLGGLAATEGQTVTGDITKEVIKMFNDACLKVQNEVGFDEQIVCFVNPTVWAAIQNTPELNRQLVLNDFKKGDVTLKVKSINGICILPVADARMKTAYTFLDGVTGGEEDGGFTPTENAQSIGMLVMPKKAASLVRKSEKIRTFSPDQNQSADAYKFDYRTYYDVIVKNSLKKSIYAYVY